MGLASKILAGTAAADRSAGTGPAAGGCQGGVHVRDPRAALEAE